MVKSIALEFEGTGSKIMHVQIKSLFLVTMVSQNGGCRVEEVSAAHSLSWASVDHKAEISSACFMSFHSCLLCASSG